MADIPQIVWELAAYIHDELFYHRDKYPDETGQLWFLRESIDGMRRDAAKPYQVQNNALTIRIRELEADVARKDAALEAADKKIITARALAKDAMLKGQLPENEHAIKLVNADIELCGARALIAAALKAEEVKK